MPSSFDTRIRIFRRVQTNGQHGLDLVSRGTVNVWILCNEDAGRGVSADDVKDLVERAGHKVRGVAKEYDEGMPLPDGHLDLVVAAGGDGTVATVARVASKTSAA